MIHRCIMIFTHFTNQEMIEKIRKIYDPLYGYVDPHITLVFPFKSSIATCELEGHIRKSLRHIKQFELTLQGITKEKGNYLFLNITKGTESLVELHKQLYTEILSDYYPDFLKKTNYKPHLTLGRTKDSNELDEAYKNCKSLVESFSERITEVTVEIIDENEKSEIEMTIELCK
ncbi:2'-5' RNA ligase family protein [Cohnella sp. WQ 127256]|uniref:2'-5' RNA ligase family protein n=1 Tax=Cohnella sp. WQ 127256 TaxID=2938790 RepID=UPI0021195E87|nr:2'-5' RNA ligase family protein [Cohnella sp. WQ 127256]